MRARNDSASDVRPEHSGPASSLMAPSGKPPSSRASTLSMPVGAWADHMLPRSQCGGNPVREAGFDLQTNCGSGRHAMYSPYIRL